MKSRQIWTTSPEDYELAADWTPEGARQVHMDRPAVLRHKSLLLVLLSEGKDEYLTHVHRWNDRREDPSLVHVARLPKIIGDPAHASQVVHECVGVFRFLRRTCPSVEGIEVVSGYPLALAPLLSYHLRTLGPLHFYDEVKGAHQYRLATTIQ